LRDIKTKSVLSLYTFWLILGNCFWIFIKQESSIFLYRYVNCPIESFDFLFWQEKSHIKFEYSMSLFLLSKKMNIFFKMFSCQNRKSKPRLILWIPLQKRRKNCFFFKYFKKCRLRIFFNFAYIFICGKVFSRIVFTTKHINSTTFYTVYNIFFETNPKL